MAWEARPKIVHSQNGLMISAAALIAQQLWARVDNSCTPEMRPVSVRLTNLIWSLELPTSEKIVLISLADQARDDGQCWPSIRVISRRTGLCERAVQMALRRLERREFLSRVERLGKGVIYRVHPCIPCTTPASGAPQHDMRPSQQLMHPTPASDAPKPSLNHNESPSGREQPIERVYRAAGWRPPTEAKAERARADLQEWLAAAGYDLDSDILPGIEKARAQKPDSTSSLRRFTTTIAARNRDRLDADSRRASDAPKLELDHSSESEIVTAIRARLRYGCGARTYDSWIKPCRFDVQGETLIVVAPSQFMLDWIEKHFHDRINSEARKALGDSVIVEWRKN